MQNPEDILLKYWGHASFRKGQDAIIASVLSGRDTLALLPTGGGKSVCFQVPAMCLEGLCIVVSPLLALMNDQIDNLKRKGIAAVSVNSAMSKAEIDTALDQCIYGSIKFLYVSPERLQNELFIERIKRMKVNLLAIDEAHCISQWGYDFRPSYLKIADVRERIPEVPVLALTASATPKVVDDIQDKLRFRTKHVFRSSFGRENLYYISRYEEDAEKKVLEVCRTMRGSGIVYCNTRKKTKELSQWLNKHKIGAGYYHAGMTHQERASAYNKWFLNEDKVMCATNAFGMGIDKPDVRFVLHAHVPASLEAYFQEAGRAGRDGKTAYAGLFWNEKHLDDLKEQLEQRYPDRTFIRFVYDKLCISLGVAMGDGGEKIFQLDIAKWIRQHAMPFAETHHALSLLERSEYLTISDPLNRSSAISVIANKDEVFRFMETHNALEPLLGGLIRTLPGVMHDFVHFREEELRRTLGIAPDVLISQMHVLEAQGMILYKPFHDLPIITLLQPRVHESRVFIPTSVYEDRKKADVERLNGIEHYLKTKRCRSIQLLEYFGESGAKACGHCDVCKEEQAFANEDILKKMELYLLGNPESRIEALLRHIGKAQQQIALELIRQQLDDGLWTEDKKGQIHITRFPKQSP
jgi:ATP-dependent DNA helicase RecQ